ncbi:hypothetical protein PG997_002084 [Apiospora hydei]|uniref:Uncharacterized protein n=1 Tax=Apiospora hydei TaxID=1337664 RepID=A0ABR1X8F9_9PEZI
MLVTILDYKPWCLIPPAVPWMATLALSPESRAIMQAPTTRVRRASVVWLLLAPLVTGILWIYFPEALPTFSFVTSLICLYHTNKISTLYWPEETQLRERTDVQIIANELSGLGNYAHQWKVLNLTEEHIASMPFCREQQAALLHIVKTQQAYAVVLRRMHASQVGPWKGGDKASTTSDITNTV